MKKTMRSVLMKYFTVDILMDLHEIMYFDDVDNNTKGIFICDVLSENNVPYIKLGSGTNRYGILIDGYVVKIALDADGMIDNKREFKYAKILYGDTCRTYECLETGLMAVFQYYTIFSIDDFYEHQDEMRKILARLTEEFLIGDVGISTKNYINWGISPTGKIGMIDYAYIYSLSFKSFLCNCEDKGVLKFDNDFNFLTCPYCKKKHNFTDIRKRISDQAQLEEIGDITKEGYILMSQEQECELDEYRSPFTVIKKEKPVEEIKVHNENNYDYNNPEEAEMSKLDELFNKYHESRG